MLTGPAVGVCVVVIPEVAFICVPATLLVTLNTTVQLLVAGIVMPLKLNAVAPATKVFGVVPTHVPALQVSVCVHRLLSVQELPSGCCGTRR